MTTTMTALAAWLLTYLVHSTLLLGGVALLTRWVVRREALREVLWKAALVGGVVTATVAVAFPRPGALRIDVAALGPAAVMAGPDLPGASDDSRPGPGGLQFDAADRPMESGVERSTEVESDRDTDVDTDTNTAGELDGEVAAGSVASAGRPGSGPPEGGADGGDHGAGSGAAGVAGVAGVAAGPASWVVALLAVWSIVAALLLARLAYRHARLRLLLRGRAQVPGSERAASMLTELRRTAGVWKPVRLTSTPAVATPLALGGVEICLPDRFLDELDEEEQRAALAHELAHLARRDPFWQLAGSVFGAVFFFQPLLGVARRRIRAAAEYLADGWAVSQTGSRLELARCLAAVAGWVAPSSEPALAGTVAMAEGGSPLLDRVQRLLEHEPEPTTRPALRVAVATVVVLVAAGFAPGFGPGGSAAGPSPEELDRPGGESPAWPDEGATADAPTDSDEGWGPPASAPQESLVVRRFDRPGVEGDGFVARLNEAGRDARQSPYWVAYTISSREGALRMAVDSRQWQSGDLDGRPLAAVLGVESDVAAAGPYPILVFVHLVPQGPSTRVTRIAVRRPELAMPIDGVVYWLGGPEPVESFRWLRDMYVAARSADLRETLVEAVALHPIPESETFLLRVLEEERDADTRAEAMEGLGSRPDSAIARLFFDIALNDSSDDIRREATEQLGRLGHPLAVTLLERLAWESGDPDVQRQAAESLGEDGTAAAREALGRLLDGHPVRQVRYEALDQLTDLDGSAVRGETLLTMALSDDDPDLRREAVELMERLPPDEAVAFLRRAVFESGDGTVERQAAETLGDVGTDAALEVLREILARNPSEDASFQAVEALAENYPRHLVIPALREVVTSHPSRRVRREALDELGNLGG